MLGIIAGIMSAVGAVTKALAVVGMAVTALKTIGNVLTGIAKALGIIKPDRDVEELGDRVLQAEEKGIVPDEFDSLSAWVKKVDSDDWGYDPEKNKDMDPAVKINKGIETATAVTMEKYPGLPITDFFSLAATNTDFFSPQRMEEIGKIASINPDGFSDVVKYVTGSANDHKTVDSATDILMSIEKTISPGVSDDMAYDKAASYKGI